MRNQAATWQIIEVGYGDNVLSIPLTGVPFPRYEYERRQLNVLAAVASAGLDALVVTAHGHLRYLSGYDGSGGYFAPFPLIANICCPTV